MRLHILILILLGACAPRAKAQQNYLIFKYDHNPSNCILGSTTPCFQPPFEAFTMYEFGYRPRCSELKSPLTDAAVLGQIPIEVQRQLNCSFLDSAVAAGESSAGLWADMWNGEGHCLGLTVEEYFRLLATLYNQRNANDAMKAIGYTATPKSVDRDTFVANLSSHYGAKSWVECDQQKNLLAVVLCLNTEPPYNPIDCPFDPKNPDPGSNGLNCAGPLTLPTTTSTPPAGPVKEECVPVVRPYALSAIPKSPPPPSPASSPPPSPSPSTPSPSPSPSPGGGGGENASPSPPPPPDGTGDDVFDGGAVDADGGSSNVGAIVGGVIAGIVVLAAVLAGIFVYRKRRNVSDGQDYDMAPVTRENGVSSYTYANSPGSPGGPPLTSIAAYKAASFNNGVTPSSPTSHTSSPPFTPNTSYSLGVRTPGSGATALAADPLMQYINSHLSNTSGTSRGPLMAWQLRFEDISIERPIGEGSWGRVYKGLWHQTQVAVKVLLEGNTSGEASGTESTLVVANSPIMKRLDQEASLMSQLHHPNIVQFLGITLQPAAIVTEYCARGSLTRVLQAGGASPQRAAELTWARRVSFAADCMRGILYLHTRNPPILHRDIKSANLLVTASWSLKVTDFNLSKIVEDSTRSSSMNAMNPRWLAPEVIGGKGHSLASDVFALGVILWELMTWELPWGTNNPWSIVGKITNGERLAVPSKDQLPGPNSGEWPQLERYVALMQRCWAQEPADRPAVGEIMAELQEIDPAAGPDNGEL